jgi:hypothetical protein
MIYVAEMYVHDCDHPACARRTDFIYFQTGSLMYTMPGINRPAMKTRGGYSDVTAMRGKKARGRCRRPGASVYNVYNVHGHAIASCIKHPSSFTPSALHELVVEGCEVTER